MNGLSGYMDFPGEPFLANKAKPADAFTMGDYDSLRPGKGMAGTMVMRPRAGAAPGWPGFFGWLAATHPDMYNYARVSLPNVVEDRQGISSAGSQLGAYLGSMLNRQPKGMGFFRKTETGQNMNGFDGYSEASETIMGGLGDFGTGVFPTSAVSIFRQGSLTPAATEGITDSNPMPTTTMSAQISSLLTNLGSAFLPLYQQKKMLDIQVERARNGLPPLDTSAYDSASGGVNVGVNRSTQNTLLMLAGIAAGGFLLVKLLGKRR